MTQHPYRFDAIPVKISAVLFDTEIEKPILKFIWNVKGSQIAKKIIKKKNKAGSLTLLDFRTCYKAIIIKNSCETGIKDRSQRNRKEIPEINPCTYG